MIKPQHRELIQAALDGKIVQWKLIANKDWTDFWTDNSAINWLTSYSGTGYELRLKPPEPPKKVHTLYLVGDEVYLNYRSANAVDAALKLELDVREVKITVQGSKIISTEEVKYV